MKTMTGLTVLVEGRKYTVMDSDDLPATTHPGDLIAVILKGERGALRLANVDLFNGATKITGMMSKG